MGSIYIALSMRAEIPSIPLTFHAGYVREQVPVRHSTKDDLDRHLDYN